MLVDPDGRAPIYAPDGTHLRTDDGGLQGNAIIMEEKYFKQGMSNLDATSHNLGINELNGAEAIAKFNGRYSSLSSRPDWDGHLTFLEAADWYRNGNGDPLFVDQNKIDFSDTDFSKSSGNTQNYALMGKSITGETGLIYGSIMIYHDGKQVTRAGNESGHLDTYDFNWQSILKSQKKVKTTIRNIETFLGFLCNHFITFKPSIEKYIPVNNPTKSFNIYIYKSPK